MIGPFIRGRREARGWTQSELAARAGLPQQYISSLERGDIRLPREHTLDALGRALGVGRRDLYRAGGYAAPADAPPGAAPEDWRDTALADVLEWLFEQPDVVADFEDARLTMAPDVYREYVRQTAQAWASNARMQRRTWELARRPAEAPAEETPARADERLTVDS